MKSMFQLPSIPKKWCADRFFSFKTGAVFCALVNAYEKDAIPVKKISSKASKKNFTLAFTFAETKWQVCQLSGSVGPGPFPEQTLI